MSREAAYLLDSHALLWWWFDPDRLSTALRELLEDPAIPVLVSAASVWELSLKHLQGKLPELSGTSTPFSWEIDASPPFHARSITTDHGLKITLDRGLDVFQWFEFSSLRSCIRCWRSLWRPTAACQTAPHRPRSWFPATCWLSWSNTTPSGVTRASQKAINTIALISRSITQTNRAFKPRTPRDIPRLGKGAAVDVTKHPYNKGIIQPAPQVPFPEADLPLATTTQQRILELGSSGDKDAEGLMQNLSALAARNGLLWLGGDEGRSLYRLQRLGEHCYGDLRKVKLNDFGLAGGKDDGESDIEGLALDGDRLWLVGSHSRRRRKHDDNKGEPLSLLEKGKQSRNAHVLGCLRLNGEGLPVAGQRLAFDAAAGLDALSQFLAADPLIAPFLNIPSKDNGLDIEGIAARAERVLVGLRGPVLRGIALVLDLHLDGIEQDGSSTLTLAAQRFRYLQLNGLAVRDLAVVPGSDDVLVLAGPTMTVAGPCYLYRWRNALRPQEPWSGAGITVEEPEPLLWIRDGRPGRPGQGSDKPEGLEVQGKGGRLLAWVAYDDPTEARREGGQGVRSRLDGFVVPD